MTSSNRVTGLAGEVRSLALSVPAGRGVSQSIIDIGALAIAPGRLVALSGPSGSGKSTLLYLLSGLLAPSAGTVSWDGTDLAVLGEGARDGWRRDNAGFVFQNFHLIEELGPVDNVLVTAWFARMSARAQRERARELLDLLGVPRERRATASLSRGEQQRVAIARALLFDPRIVFADEPTASLDAEAGRRVAGILHRLAEVEGRTVLVATHDPALLETAVEVISIDRGRIAAHGKSGGEAS